MAPFGRIGWRGRVARQAFWLRSLASLLIFLALLVVVEQWLGRRATLLLYPALYVVLTSLCVQRLHDTARSAWWLGLGFVPVLGAIWLFFELGFRRGTPGENQFGPDPLDDGRDYLTVP